MPADSYVDYSAEIIRISSQNRSMTIRYTSVDSADGREPVFRNVSLGSGVINDSSVQVLIKAAGQGIANTWADQLVSDAANPTFDDSDFIGDTYNFRYKPRTSDSYPNVDQTRFTVEPYDSEGDFEIRTKYDIVARDSSYGAGIDGATAISKFDLLKKLRDEGHLDSVVNLFDDHPVYSASWDASTGAAFDWNTDGIDYAGIDNVQRVAEGTYRVIFNKAQASANYTVTTGVGAENYTGTGASPRQLTVISRAVDSLQVHCERTDDAVDEDNAYMSVTVVPNVTLTDSSFAWKYNGSYVFNGTVMKTIQGIYDYSDSDMLVWMRDV